MSQRDSGTHRMQVRVFYEDTDASGVVYHANYLKYCERARTLWLAARGFDHRTLADNHGVVFTLADAHIAYKAPARLDDRVDIDTTVIEHRRARIVFAQDMSCREHLLVKARFTVACVRLAGFKPCGLPAELLKELE